jgi:protein-S-isoprenylcysteine O-methyltransferase Ste14
MKSLETKIPPPVAALVAGGLMKLYAYAADVSAGTSPLLAEISDHLFQISAVVALWAFASFALARTTINPMAPYRASKLVTGGIFRISRNPMCLSLLLLLIAYAIRLDSWVEWLGPVLFVSYITRFQIIPEERILAGKFGAAFLAYTSRTRRWI